MWLCTARSDGKVRPDLLALLLWLVEGEGRKHLPYPFSLHDLAFARCCERFPAQPDLRLPRPRTCVEQRMLRQAAEALADLRRLDPQAQLRARLERTWAAFRRFRSMLCLEEDELPRGPRAAAPLALPRPACKPPPPTCSATTTSSAGGSNQGLPARGAASSPTASCSAIWTATATDSPAIPWPATKWAAPIWCAT